MSKKETPSYKKELKGLIENLTTLLPAEALAIFDKVAKQLAADYSQPLKLKVGDQAPLFSHK